MAASRMGAVVMKVGRISPVVWLVLGFVLYVSAQPGFTSNRQPTTSTLYTGNNPVVQFHQTNLSSSLTGASRAWAVVFYATWCGHCQRFAPTWKELGNDIQSWSEIIQVAALACSHPDNGQLCSEYGVEAYPAIRLFPPNSEAGFQGVDYSGSETVAALRGGIVDFLSNLAHYPPEWPKLEPLDSLADPLMLRLIHNDQKRVFVVFEDEAELDANIKYIGREVILDLSKYRTIVLRRMLQGAAENYGVTQFPSLYRVHKDSSLEIMPAGTRRSGMTDYIRVHFLGLEGILFTTSATQTAAPNIEPRLPDGVHSQDLESGLYYSLFNEVAKKSSLDETRLDILKSYVNLVYKLLPVSPTIKAWLGKVKEWLDTKKAPLTSEEYITSIKDLQTKDAHIPERVIWKGCQGSKPHLRGYPCSLWTIFHTMTVQAHLNSSGEGIPTKDVLLTMRSFIVNFFGCGECAQNFQKEAQHIEIDVHSSSDGVLWLWRTHNRVNNRLHEDPTEDPRHPKIQFPSYPMCPACHVADPQSPYVIGAWKDQEVLKYLIEFYRAEKVIQDGSEYTFGGQDDTVGSAAHHQITLFLIGISSVLYFML